MFSHNILVFKSCCECLTGTNCPTEVKDVSKRKRMWGEEQIVKRGNGYMPMHFKLLTSVNFCILLIPNSDITWV